MKREELLRNPGYWTAELQNELYRQISSFMEQRKMNKTQLAEFLGCSKGYVTQLLSGDFDHKISKFVELSLAIGLIPEISFTNVEDYIEMEDNSFTTTVSIVREDNVSYFNPLFDFDKCEAA